VNSCPSSAHCHVETKNESGDDGTTISSVLFPTVYSRLIAQISANLLKVRNDDLDAAILDALRDVLSPLGVDRGGLLDVCEDSSLVKISHMWYREGVEQVSGYINLAELFPWLAHELVFQGRTMAISKPDELPPEAEIDRRSCAMMGIKSFLDIPIFLGERVHSLLVINTMETERDWPDEVISFLRLLGEIFVSALQRRGMEQLLRQTKERLDLAADSAEVVFWELDLESGALWANDKAFELFGFDLKTEMTLSRFLEKVHSEDHELIHRAVDRARLTGEDLAIEYRSPATEGRDRWMISRGRLNKMRKSSIPPRLTGITMEITRQKLMEQQLKRQLTEIEALRKQLEEENTYLRTEAEVKAKRHDLSGFSSMQAVLDKVKQVAATESTVLIQGETGTGKELIAESIHRQSERRQRVMVKVNCAALPAALVESELFGREKGAFTGALSRQVGRFELADGSTLFLDEIAEMPLETQAKLLRVLQAGEFERLGSPKTIKVNVRIIVATNRDLAAEVEQGRFRRDLYYRLNVFPITLPPLRARQEDIPHLVWEFVSEFGERMGRKIRKVAVKDMETLSAYSWPGNIRELRNVIEHAMIVSKGDVLELERMAALDQPAAAALTLEEVERQHIQAILAATYGRIKGTGGAAQRLGLNPSTLYSRMRKLGIRSPRS